MCDTLIKKDLPDNEKPQYVYKRVQKVGDGKYLSPVMGEQLKFDTWKKAPKRPQLADAETWMDLLELLKRSYTKSPSRSSSSYKSHHDGMFGSFKTHYGAKRADLISNFVKRKKGVTKKFPTIIVKCEVKGIMHSAQFNRTDTFLSEYIKIVEEVETLPSSW